MRSREEFQQTLIVIGGPDVTHNIAEYLAAGADLAVIGEGEQTMLDIAMTVDGGRWTVDGRRWTVDGGRWMVDGGRWTVDGGRWDGGRVDGGRGR
ncbi:MAG: hypothetical protein IPJ82_24470 [Lewinellaceae bacterium]|nr:hypothetical protein [Lewinellaceae bacterium]